MAVVVPLLIGSTGLGAAAAAAIGISAGTLATVAGIAFQVTGINDKINKAASKVFGEDLVNVANIFGTVYSAATGSWDISDEVGGLFGGGAEGVVNSVADLEKITPMTESAWNAAGAADAAAMDTAMAGFNGADAAAGATIETPDLFGPSSNQAPAVTDVNGYDLNTGANTSTNSVGTDTKATAFGKSAQTAPTQAPAQQPGAAGPQATQQQQVPNALKAPDALDPPKAPAPDTGSFFDKLLNNKGASQMVTGLVSGLANGYRSGESAKMAERQFNVQLERLKNRPRVTYTIGSQQA